MRGRLESIIEHGLRGFLHNCEGPPPALIDVIVERRSSRPVTDIHCVFGPDQHFIIPVDDRERAYEGSISETVALCRSIYYRLYEDHLVHLETRGMRTAVQDAMRVCIDPAQIAMMVGRLQEHERHVREHHRRSNYRGVEYDMISFDEADGLTIRPVDYRQMYVEMADVTGITPQALGVPDRTPTATEIRARQRAQVMYRGMDFGRGLEVGDPAAQAKGLALLKENLTPVQLQQYEKRKHFEVVGCDTRKLYRINHGRQMNIDELDNRHRRVCGWCFLPSGGLVVGDTMLAQKIALETNETAALKIANRFG